MKKFFPRTSLYLVNFCIIIFLAMASLGLILTLQSDEAMKALIRLRMLDISNTAASMIDGDVLGRIEAEDEATPEYQQILKTLTYFQDNIDLDYIYCIRDMGNKNFVFTIDPTIEDPGKFGEPIIYTDALYEASLGTPSVDKEAYADDWGRFYSAYTPVFDSAGKVAGIVAVDFDANWYNKQIRNQVMTTLLMSIVAIVLGVFVVLVIVSRFRKRIRLLFEQLTDLSDGIEALSDELSPDEERSAEQDISSPIEWVNDPQSEILIIGDRIRSLQKRLSEQISLVRSKAYMDGLTGLENRTAYYELFDRINDSVTSGKKTLSIAMFDLNGLKPVNDTYGHEKGDEMIREAADLLKKTFQGYGRVFRIGGDEFVAVCINPKESIETMMQRFDENLAQYNKDKDDVKLSVSKGYAVFDKSLDENCESTFVRADNAMYAEKNAYYSTAGTERRRD